MAQNNQEVKPAEPEVVQYNVFQLPSYRMVLDLELGAFFCETEWERRHIQYSETDPAEEERV